MPVAETIGNLAWVAVFGLGFGLLVLIGGFILWNVLGKKKAHTDLMKEMYTEIKHDAKLNFDDSLKFLYRAPIPPMGDYVEKLQVSDPKEREQAKDELREIFSTTRRAVYMGEIIGFNRIDLIATLEDMIMPENKFDDPLDLQKSMHKLTEDDIKDLVDMIETSGRFLNIIVYKPRKKSLLSFASEEVLLALDDQLLGVTSADAILTVLGEGTDRLMVYFSIVSGYPQKLRLLINYFTERGYVRYAGRILSSIIDVSEQASRFDSDSQKVMAFNALSNMGRPRPEGGSPLAK